MTYSGVVLKNFEVLGNVAKTDLSVLNQNYNSGETEKI